jgi:hypothetical protein
MSLQNLHFRRALTELLREMQPDLLVLDPWRNCVRDSTEKEYAEALAKLREVLGSVPKRPAVLILHHIRKPKSEDWHSGRSLGFLLSGSDALNAAARAVFVMQPATDDTEDSRVVCTCTKNNNGPYGPRGAWTRHAWFFEPVSDFDWESYDAGHSKREPKVKEEHIRQLFEEGRRSLALKHAVPALEEIAGVGRIAAYEALKLNGGRFSHLLAKNTDTELIGLRVTPTQDADGAGEPREAG